MFDFLEETVGRGNVFRNNLKTVWTQNDLGSKYIG